MRISHWSSDVCSSDLISDRANPYPGGPKRGVLSCPGPAGEPAPEVVADPRQHRLPAVPLDLAVQPQAREPWAVVTLDAPPPVRPDVQQSPHQIGRANV